VAVLLHWQRVSKKEVILEYNRNYAILAFNYILKNSKRTISASEIKRWCRNNNIELYKTLKRVLINTKVRKNIKRNI